MHSLPVFDLSRFLSTGDGAEADSVLETCQQMALCLKDAGALIVRDPRCTEEDNERFLNMMERYFERPHATKMSDSRPELHYQVRFVRPSAKGALPEASGCLLMYCCV